MDPKIYFCTFADSTYMPSLRRIKRQAKQMEIFDDIYVFTEKNIPEYAKERVKEIIKQTGKRRGFGYWSWKPAVIKEVLAKINENDILLYCDAGCHLNNKGKEKLADYIEKTKEHDIVVTQLLPQYTEYAWTKMDTIELFMSTSTQINKNTLELAQLQATTIFIKKNTYTQDIINKWDSLMNIENLHYYDDSTSVLQNHETFKENRHDQSILSLLLKSNHYYAISEENFHTYNDEDWLILWKNEPILQTRDLIKKIYYVSSWKKRLKKIKFIYFVYKIFLGINF